MPALTGAIRPETQFPDNLLSPLSDAVLLATMLPAAFFNVTRTFETPISMPGDRMPSPLQSRNT